MRTLEIRRVAIGGSRLPASPNSEADNAKLFQISVAQMPSLPKGNVLVVFWDGPGGARFVDAGADRVRREAPCFRGRRSGKKRGQRPRLQRAPGLLPLAPRNWKSCLSKFCPPNPGSTDAHAGSFRELLNGFVFPERRLLRKIALKGDPLAVAAFDVIRANARLRTRHTTFSVDPGNLSARGGVGPDCSPASGVAVFQREIIMANMSPGHFNRRAFLGASAGAAVAIPAFRESEARAESIEAESLGGGFAARCARRERRAPADGSGCSNHASGRLARNARTHRDEERLRSRPMRSLYRAYRGPARVVVPDPRSVGQRAGDNHRGAR